ncbi:hypothetical protein [Aggregatibacter sp.]
MQAMLKEEIFKQLDHLSDVGGDIVKAQFIAHLCNLGKITEAEALKITEEYIAYCEKRNKKP